MLWSRARGSINAIKPFLRQFAELRLVRIPDETIILNFRWRLEKHVLAERMISLIT